jgi:hypothetical protein
MGSLPRLGVKTLRRYRKGSTNEYWNCGNCENLVKVTFNRGGAEIGEWRCKLFGLNAGRRYRVRTDYTCNARQPREGEG